MMQETNVTDENNGYDSFDEQSNERPTERWAPLGAASNPEPSNSRVEERHPSQLEQLTQLEEEQEQLNNSLLALTTHFAQVQFRLKQIVSAEPDEKESLLKDLEEFAFKGIPDVRGSKVQDAQLLEEMSDKEHELKISQQREKQQELIKQLKAQLEDLETYAYETGDSNLPTSRKIEKQSVIIDELKNRLDLKLDNFDRLSAEELRQVVDHAIGQIVNPAKLKEKLVEQLTTQITDLERFIQFLQGEASSPGPLGKERCLCPVHKTSVASDSGHKHDSQLSHSHKSQPTSQKGMEQADKMKESHANMIKKTLAMLQMFVITQLGCGSSEFRKNLLKKTTVGNHWGDLRARLEIAIDKVYCLAKEQQEVQAYKAEQSDSYSSDSDESLETSSPALTQAVRKDLAMAIRDLMQHGLCEPSQSTSLVPFGCLSSKSAAVIRDMHAWDLMERFYEMKHGREYNESPARKLAQSYHLEIIGGKAITAKQTLLGAINTVKSSHAPLKRSEDAHLKAFVSLSLNEKKLSTWLKLIFRTQALIDNYYQDWSYAARTGFDDAIKALEKLSSVPFHLPVDLAVRPFSNIKDAF
ncbi:hypothetical protein ACJMK2_020268 [Sinanodonta woodiana]|uniref:RUN domain-containing protein n=1 Tax=Sinanodonta woodiana TaxID=1069815 RepID=A0ABD3TYJ4_SINWO